MSAPSPEVVRVVSVRRRGVERTLAVLGPCRTQEYRRLVAAVAPRIEAGLSPRALANRVASSTVEPPTLVLRPWPEERRRFAEALSALAGSHRALAFADVAACYASIGPAVVGAALERLGAPGGEVEAFLSSLGPEGVRGLPIGPHPSAVLANAVLGHADRALERAGIAHLRWVDDFVLGVGDAPEGAAGLRLLRGSLADLGLSLNGSKTRLALEPAGIAGLRVSGGRGR